MNDAAQIRRCIGALRANRPLPPTPDPKISNREPLRLEINVTQTKQTTAPHSNREYNAYFPTAIRPAAARRRNELSSAGKPPAIRKRLTGHPSFLLRLKSIAAICFLQFTRQFNRTQLRSGEEKEGPGKHPSPALTNLGSGTTLQHRWRLSCS